MKLKVVMLIFALLYVVGAGLWAIYKISAGCPCGWVVDCIQSCGTLGGILESYIAWGLIAAALAIPVMLIAIIVRYAARD